MTPKKSTCQSFSDDEVMNMAGNLRAGVPMGTPVFDGAGESDIHALV